MSDHDFLLTFHSNFALMHSIQDNEVSLQAGYDIIVTAPPWGALRQFTIYLLNAD